MFLLLGMASILMIFVGVVFRGRKDDPAFAKGFYLSMVLVVISLVLLFIHINRVIG
jgi:uncharacterized membrane protein